MDFQGFWPAQKFFKKSFFQVLTYVELRSSLGIEKSEKAWVFLQDLKAQTRSKIMKKVCLILAVMLLASSAFSAEVLSQNAVGFIKIDLDADQYGALTYPFYGMTADEQVNGILWTNTPVAKAAAVDSMVYFWNGSAWAGGTLMGGRTSTNWAASVEAKRLLPGETFFYKPAAAQTVVISGEVPADNTYDISVVGASQFSAISVPYPVTEYWTNTPIAKSASVDSIVYFWNGAAWSGGALMGGRTSTNWAATVEGKIIQAGEGFFFQSVSTDQDKSSPFVRPYSWPNEGQ